MTRRLSQHPSRHLQRRPRISGTERSPKLSVLNHERCWRKRFRGVMVIFAIMGLALAGRLLYLQTLEAPLLQRKALHMRNSSPVLFNRGRIVDRNGRILAQDNFLYDVYAHPKFFRRAFPKSMGQNPQQIALLMAQALAPALRLPQIGLLPILNSNYDTQVLAKGCDKSVYAALREARLTIPMVDSKTGQPIVDAAGHAKTRKVSLLSMLDIVPNNNRNYPQGSLAAHILGYVNDQAQVAGGLEDSAKSFLRTKPVDMEPITRNSQGEVIDVQSVRPESLVEIPKARDLQLTVDAYLQHVAERELIAGIAKSHAERGTVIMLDPRNGEVLAYAVAPSYIPERYYDATPQALTNWPISEVYPPGSTMKILTVASGLETGVIHPDTHIEDTGTMKLGNWTIKNYDYAKHGAPGMIDLVYLFQHSSNIASAKISMMMHPAQHRALLDRFGFGHRTGIELPGESRGILNGLDAWDQTTHATIGYGYGLAATPLQMAAAVASIANRGVWVTPHLIKEPVPAFVELSAEANAREVPLTDQATEAPALSVLLKPPAAKISQHRVLSVQTTQSITRLLQASIIKAGEKSTVRLDGVAVAGKTGTSRKPKSTGRGYSSDIFTSFVGYFPAERPQVLVMVVVDSPQMAEAWGSTVAGPIFQKIATETVRYLGIPKTSAPLLPPAKTKIQ